MTGLDIVLTAVGAFYVFAAYALTRAVLTSHLLDVALAQISGGKPSSAERALVVWHLGSAVVIFAGGAMLAMRLAPAAWLFLVAAAGQALYLGWLAPRYFDRDDPPEPAGRRKTINAFVVYCAATALVVWAWASSGLVPLGEARWSAAGIALAATLAFAGYVAWQYLTIGRQPAGSTWAGDGSGPDDDPAAYDDTPIDLSRVTRVKVMADYYCQPLWAMDEGMFGDIAPASLGLSADLTRELEAWAETYTASLDPDDPATGGWTEAQHREHQARGRALAYRLADERQDLTVFFQGTGDPVVVSGTSPGPQAPGD
jgi:hypothetical protein